MRAWKTVETARFTVLLFNYFVACKGMSPAINEVAGGEIPFMLSPPFAQLLTRRPANSACSG
jgi:hypothetical protein